jgi:dsRNA-specific ribonuclease
MKVKIQKDKKLADAVEAMVATVGMAGGIAASYEYLRSIDIVKTEIRVLQKRLDELLTFTEPAIFTEIEDNYAIYRMDEVEAKINYKFKNRTLLMQAFTHRTFSDYLHQKKGIRLQDYNVLEFLGDSLLNYLVLDFFYRHSQGAYAEDYTHDVMHRLKSEITNNNFFGFVMVETGLCEKILKVEKCNFNEHFQFYIDIIRDSLSNKEEGTGRSSSTREIYEDFYVTQVGLEEELKGVDMRKEFMKP